jgi:DNA-directed RNA polymerase specialized sigma24 family protein
VRNTLLKAFKQQSRQPSPLLIDDEGTEPADPQARPPERVLADSESARVVDHAFVLFLGIYLIHYEKLSPKMKRALARVEIDGRSYRDTAEELGMPSANFKVAVFRARRKILRGMSDSLAALATA